MLRRLEIENYGLIERAVVEFADGATIFTGETGSGKTMLLGALGFVLGARAAADVVRRGAPKATVTLAFDPNGALRSQLAADGFAGDPGEEATIVREMSDGGRSAVRVCGRPSTAAYVREISGAIAEVVGQFEAQRLLAPAYHQELLDRYGGKEAVQARNAVAAAHARLEALELERARLHDDERSAREQYDDALFALREIEAVRPEGGEDERLDERRRYLDNRQRIAEALGRAHEALVNDDSGAVGALGEAGGALAGIAGIATNLRTMAEQAAGLQSQSNDLAASIARALDASDLDAGELDAINGRLDALDRLKRKYGGSIEGALDYATRARELASAFESRDRRASELESQVEAADAGLRSRAATLTQLRKRSAAALRKRVVAEFADLALGSGAFEVAFETLPRIGAGGAERVEFLFAANAGEPARALGRIASGGELSRVLLALIVAVSAARDSAALVFDEIDTGIGGTTGAAVGTRIGRLARDGQVVCVTHLAQLATWAQRHYLLEKNERRNVTSISVREITGAAARESELARMLSGETHDVALKHARELLRRSGGS